MIFLKSLQKLKFIRLRNKAFDLSLQAKNCFSKKSNAARLSDDISLPRRWNLIIKLEKKIYSL